MTQSLFPSQHPIAPVTSSVLSRVEKELRDLWAAPTKPGEVPTSRVCTMNLVVAAGSRQLAERYTPIADEVAGSIPSRVIVVALEPDASTHHLEADATPLRSTGDEGRPIGSERIRLNASGVVCARVGSAVEALLVPEIQTSLVWLGRVHVDDAVFLSMASEAQRVVLDTEYTSLGSLLNLVTWAREDSSRPSVADLAWTRLATWQELSARFFDEPALRSYARGVRRIVIRQASEPGARLGSEAALLLGWFGTRLGWKVTRVGGSLRFQRQDGRSLLVQLESVPRPEGVAPAALASVSLEAEVDGKKMKASIERDLASGNELSGKTADADVVKWCLDVDGQPTLEQRVRLRANKGARVLERTLHRPMVDPALMESAAFAEQYLEEGTVVA